MHPVSLRVEHPLHLYFIPSNSKMLLFSQHLDASVQFAAWQITEDEAFFRQDLPLAAAEEAEIQRYQLPLRRLEWLAARWLLHRLTGSPERLLLIKNNYSKPFFLDHPHLHCSLSHSHGTVAALLSEQVCGCDIQMLVPKIERIAHKFMNPSDFDWVDTYPPQERLELLHLFWTAKEALYKAHGLKELDFKEHLWVDQFSWKAPQTVETNGEIRKEGKISKYTLKMGKFEWEAGVFLWTVALSTPKK